MDLHEKAEPLGGLLKGGNQWKGEGQKGEGVGGCEYNGSRSCTCAKIEY
jgi:hypothetical protein